MDYFESNLYFEKPPRPNTILGWADAYEDQKAMAALVDTIFENVIGKYSDREVWWGLADYSDPLAGLSKWDWETGTRNVFVLEIYERDAFGGRLRTYSFGKGKVIARATVTVNYIKQL